MIRCFVALPLPEGTRARLEALQYMLPLAHRVPSGNMHVTLAFLGTLDDATLEAVHEELSAIRSPAFDIRLDGIGSFGGQAPRVIHVPVRPTPPLTDLQAAVARAVRRAGADPGARRYVPHVTLSRARPRGAELMRLEHAVAGLAGYRDGPVPVRGFALYRSDLGKGAPRYTPLAEYPLAET